MHNRLLTNIYYGSELEKLQPGVESTIQCLRNSDDIFKSLDQEDWQLIIETVKDFFKKRIIGIFGGPISAGDAFFISAFMLATRPKQMVEIGVCSGLSSSFITYAARRLKIIQPSDDVFLTSIDITDKFGDEKKEVGQVMKLNFEGFLKHWDLKTGITSLDLLKDNIKFDDDTLVFIDAEHLHPWPTIDIVSVSKLLGNNGWILLQDTQLMERWLANSVEYGVPSPSPCRGVNIAFSHWSGRKIIGTDICYNMGAFQSTDDDEFLLEYFQQCFNYADEMPHEDGESCRAQLRELVKRG